MNEILTEEQVAELLDCAPATVQEKARNGELPALKIGRSWRFPKAALLDALDALARANRAPAKPKANHIAVPPVTAGNPRGTPTSARARRALPKLIEVRT